VKRKLITLGVMMCSISNRKVKKEANVKNAVFRIRSSTEQEYDERNVVVIDTLLFL
jgi:hypothetical protein